MSGRQRKPELIQIDTHLRFKSKILQPLKYPLTSSPQKQNRQVQYLPYNLNTKL
jgi:hypothetical protein